MSSRNITGDKTMSDAAIESKRSRDAWADRTGQSAFFDKTRARESREICRAFKR